MTRKFSVCKTVPASSGFREAFTSAKKAGGALKLLSLKKRNVELLLLTKLHTVFEVFAEEDDAVNSFFPDRVFKRLDISNFVQQREI